MRDTGGKRNKFTVAEYIFPNSCRTKKDIINCCLLAGAAPKNVCLWSFGGGVHLSLGPTREKGFFFLARKGKWEVMTREREGNWISSFVIGKGKGGGGGSFGHCSLMKSTFDDSRFVCSSVALLLWHIQVWCQQMQVEEDLEQSSKEVPSLPLFIPFLFSPNFRNARTLLDRLAPCRTDFANISRQFSKMKKKLHTLLYLKTLSCSSKVLKPLWIPFFVFDFDNECDSFQTLSSSFSVDCSELIIAVYNIVFPKLLLSPPFQITSFSRTILARRRNRVDAFWIWIAKQLEEGNADEGNFVW